MIVTSILEYDKKKVLVHLDEYLIFPLYKAEVRKYGLEEQAELSADTYEELFHKLLPKRAKLRAMHLLQKHSYTREGLKKKLTEGRYPEDVVTEALDYVTAYGYIDDERYAMEYIRCYCESRSKRRIMMDLHSKGVSGEVAEKAWQMHESQNEPVDETAQIMELLRKKKYDAAAADYKEKSKVMNYLYRKGYSVDKISQCMNCEDFYTNL